VNEEESEEIELEIPKRCEYVFKKGKNEGNHCGRNCYGLDGTEIVVLCSKHKK
jgi:hypothetical protein